MTSERKKLILVVHGIGEQTPGDTLDYLVGAALENQDLQLESELRWLKEEPGPGSDDDDRQVKLFPCPIRRIEPVPAYGKKKSQATEKPMVFAEVYWADLSRGREGLLGTGYEFVKGVLGMGHLVRESVDQFCTPRHLLNRLATLFVYAFNGPIMALTALFFAIALVGFGLNRLACLDAVQECKGIPEGLASLVVLLFGAAAVGFGWWGSRPKSLTEPSYLFRTFSWSLLGAGALLAVFAVLTGFPEPWRWSGLRDAITAFLLAGEDTSQNGSDPKGFLWYGVSLLSLLRLIWLAVLIGLTFLFAGQFVLWRRRLRDRLGEPQPPETCVPALYPIICGMMVLAWAAAIFAFSGIARAVIPPTPLHKALFDQGTRFMTVTAFEILLFIGLAMVIWLYRDRKIDRLWESNPRGLEFDKLNAVPRLIVNRFIGFVLIFVVLFSTAAAICIRLEDHCGIVCIPSDLFACVPDWLKAAWDQRLKVSFALFTVLGVLYLVFAKQVSAGLAIGKDVLTYFRREPDPKAATGWSYPLRERMESRFNIVLKTMIASEGPTEIEVIAHSLGSVFAIQELQGEEDQKAMAAGKIGKSNRKLATMGSPYDHLFKYYFPEKSKDCPEGEFTTPTQVQMPLQEWVNIFRFDDFVGTLIKESAKDWPVNRCVAPDGHTNYWTDDQVLKILKAKGYF